MNKTEKAVLVDNLTKELKEAKSVILVDYAGLGITQQRELKKRLKEISARFFVSKNTLLKLAGKNAKVSDEALTDTVLSGQTALVFADADPVKPLSVLNKFAKEFERPKLKVGIIEGSFQNKGELETLAALGSKDAVIGGVIGILNAPTFNLVNTLHAKLHELVYVLSNLKSQNSEVKAAS
jgi:large subunit ribosomal protein L10